METKNSLVGDPIIWPSLVYAPLNMHGLLFALGTVARQAGLIFEEFYPGRPLAVCRRKTADGWEKVIVGLAVKSSEFTGQPEPVDLIICWYDDTDGTFAIPRLELSRFRTKPKQNAQSVSLPARPALTAEEIRGDHQAGNDIREDFEETIRQLDDRIKKLKGS